MKTYFSCLILIFFCFSSLLIPRAAFAAPPCGDITINANDPISSFRPTTEYALDPSKDYKMQIFYLVDSKDATFSIKGNSLIQIDKVAGTIEVDGGPAKISDGEKQRLLEFSISPNDYDFRIKEAIIVGSSDIFCAAKFHVVGSAVCKDFSVVSELPKSGYYDTGTVIIYEGIFPYLKNYYDLYAEIKDGDGKFKHEDTNIYTDGDGKFQGYYEIEEGTLGTWTITLYKEGFGYAKEGEALCSTTFQVGVVAGDLPNLVPVNICDFIPEGDGRADCVSCVQGDKPGIPTPFGCIPAEPQAFVERILRIAINMAGGIAFLMIIYGGFLIMTSSGNPEKLTNGKEIVTSAIAGLLLIIFSVVILKIIGVDILVIPGFG